MFGINIFALEVSFMIFIQNLFEPYVPFFSIITHGLGEILIILLIFFLYFCYDKQLSKSIAIMLSLSFIINSMIKNIFMRKRPYFDHSSIKCLEAAESNYAANDLLGQGFSFPSAHSEMSFIVFASIAYEYRDKIITILAISGILLVGLSRVFLGVHYPTDVLGGWILGILLMIIYYYISSKIENENILYLIILIISASGLLFCGTADYFRALGILFGFIVAFVFEKKYVNFTMPKTKTRMVIRIISGFIVLGIFYMLFKILFDFDAHSSIAYLAKFIQFSLTLFISLGVFPLFFKYFDKYF